MTAAVVQLFFARRFWLLKERKGWAVSLLMVILALGGLGCGICLGSLMYTLPRFSDVVNYLPVITCWQACSTACDIVITFSVSWALWNSKTGFKSTDRLIGKLMVWTINTGALTSILALINIVSFLTTRDTLIYLAAHFILTKLYTNSMLASLNRRNVSIPIDETTLDNHWTDDDVELPTTSSSASSTADGMTVTSTSKPPQQITAKVRVATTRSNYADSLESCPALKKSKRKYYDKDGVTEAERRAMAIEPATRHRTRPGSVEYEIE